MSKTHTPTNKTISSIENDELTIKDGYIAPELLEYCTKSFREFDKFSDIISEIEKNNPKLYKKLLPLNIKELSIQIDEYISAKNKKETYPLFMGVNSHKALKKDEIEVRRAPFNSGLEIDLKRFGVQLLEPDLFAGQKDLEKLALNHALNIQRDLKYTPLEQKISDYCVYLAYLNGNTGAFYFTPDKILDGFGADKNTVQRRRIGKAFYSILNKKIEFKKTVKIKGLNYEIKVKNITLILKNGEIEITEKTLDGKEQKIVESGRFIFDPELYSMINKHNYYAKGEKGAFLLTPEEYLIYKCFMEKARNEKKPELIKLSYLSVIEYTNLTDKIKENPKYISEINNRLESIKSRGLFKEFYITFHSEKKDNDWYKNRDNRITSKNNTELNESLLKEYVINVVLPDSLKNSLKEIRLNQKSTLEKPKKV